MTNDNDILQIEGLSISLGNSGTTDSSNLVFEGEVTSKTSPNSSNSDYISIILSLQAGVSENKSEIRHINEKINNIASKNDTLTIEFEKYSNGFLIKYLSTKPWKSFIMIVILNFILTLAVSTNFVQNNIMAHIKNTFSSIFPK